MTHCVNYSELVVCIVVCIRNILSPYNLQSIMKKRIVQVKQQQLHMSHKHLPSEELCSSPVFFFLRTTPDPIPSPSSPEEATAILASCFEMGTMDSGHPLHALSKTLTHLYMPMLMIAGTHISYVQRKYIAVAQHTRVYTCVCT